MLLNYFEVVEIRFYNNDGMQEPRKFKMAIPYLGTVLAVKEIMAEYPDTANRYNIVLNKILQPVITDAIAPAGDIDFTLANYSDCEKVVNHFFN